MNKYSNALNEMLNLAGINEQEAEEAPKEKGGKVSRRALGIESEREFDKVPVLVKNMYYEYLQAGGHRYDTVWEFVEDMVQFLQHKGFDGRKIARWDKEKNPASGA